MMRAFPFVSSVKCDAVYPMTFSVLERKVPWNAPNAFSRMRKRLHVCIISSQHEILKEIRNRSIIYTG